MIETASLLILTGLGILLSGLVQLQKTTALGFNSGAADCSGVGGIANIWDFSVLASRGHPVLVGLPGQ